MLLDRVLDAMAARNGSPDDHVDLEWWDLDRRALRKTTRAGRAVRILLPVGVRLHDGDVLTDCNGTTRITVELTPCEVLVIRPRDISEMGKIALELGNLHAPVEIIDGTIRVVPDGPIEELIAEAGVPCETQLARFVPRPCAGMPELRRTSEFRVIGE